MPEIIRRLLSADPLNALVPRLPSNLLDKVIETGIPYPSTVRECLDVSMQHGLVATDGNADLPTAEQARDLLYSLCTPVNVPSALHKLLGGRAAARLLPNCDIGQDRQV